MQMKTNENGYFSDGKVIINKNYGDLKSYKNQVEAEKRTKKVEEKYESLLDELQQIKELLKNRGI